MSYRESRNSLTGEEDGPPAVLNFHFLQEDKYRNWAAGIKCPSWGTYKTSYTDRPNASPEAYIKGVSFNVETSSFQLTSLQTLSIKADLPCDPRLSTHFLEAMLGALIRHQDLRGLLGEDKWGNQTVTLFGLHWDLPEPERLSRIPPNSSPLPRGSHSSGLSLALHSAWETDVCVVRLLPTLVVESPREPKGLHNCMLSSL